MPFPWFQDWLKGQSVLCRKINISMVCWSVVVISSVGTFSQDLTRNCTWNWLRITALETSSAFYSNCKIINWLILMFSICGILVFENKMWVHFLFFNLYKVLFYRYYFPFNISCLNFVFVQKNIYSKLCWVLKFVLITWLNIINNSMWCLIWCSLMFILY